MLKLLGALVTIVIAAVLLVVAWPQLFGLQTTWLVAQAVSMRGLLLVAAAVMAVILLCLSAIKPIRVFAAVNAVLLLVVSLATGGLLLQRGLGSGELETGSPEAVTVLSWNTLGDAPGAQAIAELAVEVEADIVSLPETTESTGVEIAETMRSLGRPMWVHTTAFDLISPARSTTVLVSSELGDYRKVTSDTERNENTKVLPTVIVEPADGDGPTIVAAHAVSPTVGQMANWRDDLAWLAEQCGSGSVIMAGDFNATVDSMAGLETENGATLGACSDAAVSSGDGAVGTWPTSLPSLVGSPIDHVMATSDWHVEDTHVLTEYDNAGSDHRPVVARLTPSG
ncbi:endonuclease/exonuclease/phosphatase family protein [Okibacterium endophyticum]